MPLVPTTRCPFLGSLATTLAEVTSIVAGGTKNNPLPALVTSPKATLLETPRVVTEFTIQDGKSKEENHNDPVDTAQERFSLGLWCPNKHEKQIVLKFMVFSLKVNTGIRVIVVPCCQDLQGICLMGDHFVP